MMPLRNISGVIFDAGGVLLNTKSLKLAYDAQVRYVTDFLRARNVPVNTGVVRVVMDVNKFEQYRRDLTPDDFFSGILTTFVHYWDMMQDASDTVLLSNLLKKSHEVLNDSTFVGTIKPEFKDVLEKIKAISKDFNVHQIPSAFENAITFLDFLKDIDLSYVVLTNAPYSADKLRKMICSTEYTGEPHVLSKYLTAEMVIPSHELGILKKDSDLFFLAGIVLLYSGWGQYQNIIKGKLPLINNVLRHKNPNIGDLEALINLLELDDKKVKTELSSTVAYFNNKDEFNRASSLGIRAFLCSSRYSPYDSEHFFSLRDLGDARQKLYALENILTDYPYIPNNNITLDLALPYLKKAYQEGEYE